MAIEPFAGLCVSLEMRRMLLTRKTAEARFPYKLDVRVPGASIGRRFKDMVDWCRKNTAGNWTHHGLVDKDRRDSLGVPVDFVRFYFMEESDAEAFRRAWPTEQGTAASAGPSGKHA
jgi:hypothetical protein